MPRAVLAALLGVVAIAAAIAVGLYNGAGDALTPLTITDMRGQVVLSTEGAERDGEPGMTLSPGDHVKTGAKGRAVLSRDGKAPIRLGRNTSMTLLKVEEDVVELELASGQMRARVRPDVTALRVRSHGATVLATDADFSVAADAQGNVAVEAERGDLGIRGVKSASKLKEGRRLHVFSDGQTSFGRIPEDMLLEVQWPDHRDVEKVMVEGATTPGAMVVVTTDHPLPAVQADPEGNFQVAVELRTGDTEVTVQATDAFGRTQVVDKKLTRLTRDRALRVGVDYGKP